MDQLLLCTTVYVLRTQLGPPYWTQAGQDEDGGRQPTHLTPVFRSATTTFSRRWSTNRANMTPETIQSIPYLAYLAAARGVEELYGVLRTVGTSTN
jgi:hypothetical protein